MEPYLTKEDIAGYEITENKEVYDLTVEDNHNYFLDVGKEILVHNSGKTAINVDVIEVRALKEKSRHLTIRKTFKDCKNSIWLETLPKIIELKYPQLKEGRHYKLDRSNYILTWKNGSEHWFGGMDNQQHLDKILGKEYSTIHISEASETNYEMWKRLITRLAERNDLTNRILLDQNPTNRKHYLHQLFHEGTNPIDNTPISNPEEYSYLKMNPIDNVDNIDPDYMKELENLDKRSRERFLYGNYTDDNEFALWTRKTINDNREYNPPDFSRVIVGVDPSGSSTGNECGIITAAMARITGVNHFYVLGDDSIKGSPQQWGKMSVGAYNRHRASRIVAEKNYGGEMVEAVIRGVDRYVPYAAVNATRGKQRRAEPIAALYEQGLVHHVGQFEAVEDEMCEWSEESDWSPNRLDALVWALTELSGKGGYNPNLSAASLGL